MGGLKL